MKRKVIVGLFASLMSVALLSSCGGNSGSSSSVSIPVPSTISSPEEQQATADAKRVTDLINALSDSSSDSEILAALSAYNALSELAKSKISPEVKAKLDAKVNEIRHRQEELKVQEVITAIDALDNSSSKEEVYRVKELFDSLTPELQARVTNKNKLDAQIKRVREARAKEMELVIDSLANPDDILFMDASILTKNYFEFTEVEKQYNQLTEEDLSYLDAAKKDKYLSYKSELEKSVYVAVDGITYRSSSDWESTLPTGSEEFPTWIFTDIKDTLTYQQIYAQKNLYLTDTRAFGFMVKTTDECVLNYYSHLTKDTYLTQGHVVVDKPLASDEWVAVASTLETPQPQDEQELSLFQFDSKTVWSELSSIEITSIIGIRSRSEEVDIRAAAIVEAEIQALNDESTKEQVSEVMSHYSNLSENAKSYISSDSLNKLNSFINKFFGEEINSVISAINELPEVNNYTLPADAYVLNNIRRVEGLYNNLADNLKSFITNYDKLKANLDKCDKYDVAYKMDSTKTINVIPSHVPNYKSNNGGTATFGSAYVGDYIDVTSATDGRAALDFYNFSCDGFQTLYFYVKVSVACDIYLSDGTSNDGWGKDWKNSWSLTGTWCNANQWTQIAINTNTGIFASNWSLGFRTEEKGFTYQISNIYGYKPEKVEVSYYFGQRTATAETYDSFGTVYSLIQEQWFIDHPDSGTIASVGQGVLSNALPKGFTKLTFAIYNPNATASTFHISGGNPWKDGNMTTLAPQSWTVVEIKDNDFSIVDTGTSYYYANNADAAGWKITAIFAVK